MTIILLKHENDEKQKVYYYHLLYSKGRCWRSRHVCLKHPITEADKTRFKNDVGPSMKSDASNQNVYERGCSEVNKQNCNWEYWLETAIANEEQLIQKEEEHIKNLQKRVARRKKELNMLKYGGENGEPKTKW